MPLINLRDHYYPFVTKDEFVEVSDEVAAALRRLKLDEDNRRRKMFRHKAYYTLDLFGEYTPLQCESSEPSPEEVCVARDDEAFYLLTLQRLEEALSHLSAIQARRIKAKYLMGIRVEELVKTEGVCRVAIYRSINSGIDHIRAYFKKKKWRLTE